MVHARKGWNDLETYQASGEFSFQLYILLGDFLEFPNKKTQDSYQFAGTQKDCLIVTITGIDCVVFSNLPDRDIFSCRLHLGSRNHLMELENP